MAMGLHAMQAWPREIVIDGNRSHARFQLNLPLGRELDGRFPRLGAEWLPQGDGRWRVAVWLPADAAEIPDSARYTRIMRSEMFFDSRRYPRIHFLSDPFDVAMLARGGDLSGVMMMRGVEQRETLRLSPSTCRPPVPRDCVMEATGEVSRRRYGMRSLPGVVGDAVYFSLRINHGNEP